MLAAEEVLTKLGIEITSVGDKEIAARCPFHPDAHPSFSMNISNQLWVCYQCGESGTLEMLLEKVGSGKVNTTQMLREVRHEATKKPKEPPPPIAEPVVESAVVQVRYEDLGPPPKWAHTDRRISTEAMAKYGIKWDHGYVIPIWSPDGDDLWGWQFKRLDFVSNYPKAVKKSQTLFGLRELEVTTLSIVESPLDVVRLASVGIPAVATYGAFVSRAQLALIDLVADKVLIALDDDEEGNRQAEKIFPFFAKMIPTVRIKMPKGCKDPGDMSDQQVEDVFGSVQGKALRLPKRGRRPDAGTGEPPPGARPRARQGTQRRNPRAYAGRVGPR